MRQNRERLSLFFPPCSLRSPEFDRLPDRVECRQQYDTRHAVVTAVQPYTHLLWTLLLLCMVAVVSTIEQIIACLARVSHSLTHSSHLSPGLPACARIADHVFSTIDTAVITTSTTVSAIIAATTGISTRTDHIVRRAGR